MTQFKISYSTFTSDLIGQNCNDNESTNMFYSHVANSILKEIKNKHKKFTIKLCSR